METDDLGDTAATAPASQPTTTAAPPAASRGHGDDDEQLDSPELRRGLSANLEWMENTLRDPAQLVEAQQRDPTLGPIRALLEAGRGNGTNYVLADDHLLWHAPRGWTYAIAVPRHLVPGVLALSLIHI